MGNSDGGGIPADGLHRFIVTGNAGDVIFEEGDSSAEMFIIQAGRVELLRRRAGVQEQVAVLDAGDCFGEVSLFEGTPREVTARAVTDFSALKLDAPGFRQVALERPDVPFQLIRRLTGRLHEYWEADWRAPRPAGASSQQSAMLVERQSGKRMAVPRGRALVGRIDRTTRQVPDIDLTSLENGRSAGRRHAFITFHDGTYSVLEEAPSANGTFVNEVRVQAGVEAIIRSGDQVRFGLVDFVFRIE